jgi:hypothetical protein
MGRYDDETILPNWTLARAVRVDWIGLDEAGKETIQSWAFDDCTQEVSCFVVEEVGGVDGFRSDVLPTIENELGTSLRFATVAVGIVRATGLWIYRKPEEFHGNTAHVVMCPAQTDDIPKKRFRKLAREIASHAVLHPPGKNIGGSTESPAGGF